MGLRGVGKISFVNSIHNRIILQNQKKASHSLPIYVKAEASASTSTVQLVIWKTILFNIFHKIGELLLSLPAYSRSQASVINSEIISRENLINHFSSFDYCLEMIKQRMTLEQLEMLPLALQLVLPGHLQATDNAKTAKLSGANRLSQMVIITGDLILLAASVATSRLLQQDQDYKFLFFLFIVM